MKVTVNRKAHFNAAHRLFRPEWSDEKNLEVFGKCSNPHYHGHNYDVTVSVTGQVDQKTGFVMDMKELKDIIKTEIEDVFDHKNLNEEVPEFNSSASGLNPTSENIVVVIWKKLRPHINKSHDLAVTLYETPRNFVSFNGG